ncbi:MAG: LicD family protein, partial [Lachnospiraceae bacterium]|nr:LicD family protein [Lachnospiraceae bacterium]
MIDSLLRLRRIQLELLDVFAEACEAHGLQWYAFFGTLLGIQREGGYLPLDDDVDVAMPLKDYLILCEHREWFDSSKYYLQIPQDTGLVRFAHLRRNGTTAFREPFIDSLKAGGHHGISIDIIPLAELPGMGAYHTPSVLNPGKREAVYLKEWFEPYGVGAFENRLLRIPAKPRKVLTETYEDWAWPHGVMESRPTFWFFDTERGYEAYVRRYTGMLEGIEGKRIYLFGAADSLRIWLERFDRRDQVVCTFDNDSGKWGQKAYGVEIRNPSELARPLGEDSRIIIVSLWHQEIGRQLEEMGIEDYYVYLDDYYDEKVG